MDWMDYEQEIAELKSEWKASLDRLLEAAITYHGTLEDHQTEAFMDCLMMPLLKEIKASTE
jgi:hypothetical protein